MTTTLPANAQIGPNAISQLGLVLKQGLGEKPARQVFESAGLAVYWRWPPERMVPEAEVARLYRSLHRQVGPTLGREMAVQAGLRTGQYLLRNRIPWFARLLLRALPACLAAPLLVKAISAHAWTFAGSGSFHAQRCAPGSAGRSLRWVLSIHDNPMCKPAPAAEPACQPLPRCDFHAAVFECLFASLVHPRSRVREVACESQGAEACRFEVSWP